jgi:alpha-glucosidase
MQHEGSPSCIQSKRGLQWWQTAVFYEIAPISFQDTDCDGKGDLPGLISRLDYLEWLGIDAVWLTPIYPSPMLDLGYDIADFCAIDPVYGTLQDFDQLVLSLHARGMRLILDFVPNHTSDRHSWFEESMASRTNEKADWYIWADAARNGGAPNNWLSRFGGSAWQWSEQRQQYYYHSFLAQQPDLNWRNAQVRSAMFDVLRFWLRRGVDGFRIDASAVLIKDDLLRDNPPDPDADEDTPPPQRFKPAFTDDRPEAMACIEQIRAVLDEFDDKVLAGEVQGKTDRIGHFYDNNKPRLHLPLNFTLLESAWDAVALQATIDAYLKAIPEQAWPDWVIGGHDKPRIASKIGQAQARILAMLVLTLRGTPFLFAGDEIGMERVKIPENRIVDPFEKLVGGYGLNRDPDRTPMQWEDGLFGGFSSVDPWLPMGNVSKTNVEQQRSDRFSLLTLYRRLLSLRRQEPALRYGAHKPMRSRNDVITYERALDQAQIAVALNTVDEPRLWEGAGQGALLLSSYLDRDEAFVKPSILLRGNEGIIVRRG